MITVHVSGAPRTKKTHNRVVRAGQRLMVLPSKYWAAWCRDALIEYGVNGASATFYGFQPLTTAAVNCRALFYRDALRGDAVGFYQGLADLLEKRGVLKNDAQIVSWDGSRLCLDRENPRVELVLEPVA